MKLTINQNQMNIMMRISLTLQMKVIKTKAQVNIIIQTSIQNKLIQLLKLSQYNKFSLSINKLMSQNHYIKLNMK